LSSVAVIIKVVLIIIIFIFVIIGLPSPLGTAFLRTLAGLRPRTTVSVCFLLWLLILNERAKDSNLVILVSLEVKSEFLPKTQLQEVVIQGFFGNSNLGGGIL